LVLFILALEYLRKEVKKYCKNLNIILRDGTSSIIIVIVSQMLVAYACNPSYSGSRDQEDRGLKPALGQ
jgi:hypothetical protein